MTVAVLRLQPFTHDTNSGIFKMLDGKTIGSRQQRGSYEIDSRLTIVGSSQLLKPNATRRCVALILHYNPVI